MVSKRKNTRAFTLVEVMVSMTLAAILLAGIISSNLFATKSMYLAGDYADMNRQARRALDLMAADVRQLTSVTINSNGFSGTIANPDKTASTMSISYAYDSTAHTLTRTYGSNQLVLVRNINTCVFNCYSIGAWSSSLGRMDRGTPLSVGTASKVKQIQVQIGIQNMRILTRDTQQVISAQFSVRA